MKSIIKMFVCLLVILGLTFTGAAMAADYDLVILNGRVMDPETMRDEIAYVDIEVANVGIKDVLTAIHKYVQVNQHQ